MDGEIRDALEQPSVSASQPRWSNFAPRRSRVVLPESHFGNFCFFGTVIKFELTIHEKEIYHLGFSIYSERGWGCGVGWGGVYGCLPRITRTLGSLGRRSYPERLDYCRLPHDRRNTSLQMRAQPPPEPPQRPGAVGPPRVMEALWKFFFKFEAGK